LSTETYHKIADTTLECMVDKVEALGEEVVLNGFDIEYSQGVMTLNLGEHGTYVVNKQPPTRQLWLSSPKSGPKRFDYDASTQTWFYHRDSQTLDRVLNSELSDIFHQPVDLFEALKEERD
ncbi:Frataxin-like domain-containing protein, partial [Spinellus fusiger]